MALPGRDRGLSLNVDAPLVEERLSACERIVRLRKRHRRRRYLRLAGALSILIGISIVVGVLLTNTYNSREQQQLEQVWLQSRSEILAELQNQGATVSAEPSVVVASEIVKAQTETPETKPPAVTATTLDPQAQVEQRYYQELQETKAFAKIVIPKIELDKIVVEGTSRASLKQGPGHIKKTGIPGEIGNIAISGHRVTYGAPFYRLNDLAPGDSIHLYSPTDKYEYKVVNKKIVSPKDVSVIKPTDDSTLTLTTCHPPHSARYRLIIVAKLKPPLYMIGGPR